MNAFESLTKISLRLGASDRIGARCREWISLQRTAEVGHEGVFNQKNRDDRKSQTAAVSIYTLVGVNVNRLPSWNEIRFSLRRTGGGRACGDLTELLLATQREMKAEVKMLGMRHECRINLITGFLFPTEIY